MRPAGYPHPIPARCSSEIGALTMRYTNSHRQIASDDAQLFFDRFHPNHHFLSWSPTNQISNTPPHRHEHAMHAHQRLVDTHTPRTTLSNTPTARPSQEIKFARSVRTAVPITLSSRHFQLKEEVRHSISTVPYTQSFATFIATDHPIGMFPHAQVCSSICHSHKHNDGTFED